MEESKALRDALATLSLQDVEAAPYLQSLPPSDYLDYTNVQFYLQDAVRQLLVKRDQENPVTFFRDYFKRLQSQSHVQQREFGFITRTQYNKRAFVLLCEDTFTSIIATEAELNIYDLHQLLLQLCPDFSVDLLEGLAVYIPPLQSLKGGKYPVRELLDIFYVGFYFSDYFSEVCKLFSFSSSSSPFVPRIAASSSSSHQPPHRSFLVDDEDDGSSNPLPADERVEGGVAIETACLLDSLRTLEHSLTMRNKCVPTAVVHAVLGEGAAGVPPPAISLRTFMRSMLECGPLARRLCSGRTGAQAASSSSSSSLLPSSSSSSSSSAAAVKASDQERAVVELLSGSFDYDEGGKRGPKRKQKPASTSV